MAETQAPPVEVPGEGCVPHYLRSEGRVALRFERRGDGTALYRRQEGGCLRVRVPARSSARALEAVLLNTSGGLCEGDRISHDVVWAPGTEATLTSQAAEKVYTSRERPCLISSRLQIDSGSYGEWLPQETIVFDGARLQRETSIELAEDAELLWCEAVVFGRLARGERFARGELWDRVRISRGGKPVYADVTRLGERPAQRLERAALGGDARAMATVLAIGNRSAGCLEAVRSELAGHETVLAGASRWNGILAVRFLAADPAALRVVLANVLGLLRSGAEIPRVWRC